MLRRRRVSLPIYRCEALQGEWRFEFVLRVCLRGEQRAEWTIERRTRVSVEGARLRVGVLLRRDDTNTECLTP